MRSLSIWGFTFGFDQTFAMEIGNLRGLKQTSRFCIKLMHVSCKVTFFAILGFSGHTNWSDLSFPQDILVSYVAFDIY